MTAISTPSREPLPSSARALAAATGILASGAAMEPGRARTVARLLRHAVEAAADEYWEAVRPGEVVGRAGRGRQLRLLAATIDRAAAHDIYATWCMLSDASKPHPYELAATVAELRALEAAAGRAVAALCAARKAVLGRVRRSPASASMRGPSEAMPMSRPHSFGPTLLRLRHRQGR
jgi:hypothetical protein